MMIVFFLVSTLVYQNGDTLIFMKQDSIIDKWVIIEETQQNDSLVERIIKKTKISSNNRFFLIYEERCGLNYEYLQSMIVFYNADRNELWKESRANTKRISFDLSNIYDNLSIFIVSDINGKNPVVHLIKNKKEDIIINSGDWTRIVDYKLSQNCRYLVFHTRRPYARKLWDYIYFIDLKTKKDWQYLFPICISCKRGKFSLDVNNTGQVDVVYKAEHRIFSKEGKLLDIFIKLD